MALGIFWRHASKINKAASSSSVRSCKYHFGAPRMREPPDIHGGLMWEKGRHARTYVDYLWEFSHSLFQFSGGPVTQISFPKLNTSLKRIRGHWVGCGQVGKCIDVVSWPASARPPRSFNRRLWCSFSCFLLDWMWHMVLMASSGPSFGWRDYHVLSPRRAGGNVLGFKMSCH